MAKNFQKKREMLQRVGKKNHLACLTSSRERKENSREKKERQQEKEREKDVFKISRSLICSNCCHV